MRRSIVITKAATPAAVDSGSVGLTGVAGALSAGSVGVSGAAWNLPATISVQQDGTVGLRQYALNAGAHTISVSGLPAGVTYNSGLERLEGAATGTSSGTATFTLSRVGGSDVVDTATVALVVNTVDAFYSADFSGAVGQQPTEMLSFQNSGQVLYSNDISGPFSQSVVVRSSISSYPDNPSDRAARYFGGTFVGGGDNIQLGDTVWFRLYHYFPSSFCAGTGTYGDQWGRVKWVRFQWGSSGSGSRMTLQLGGFSTSSCSASSIGPRVEGVTLESFLSPATQNNWLSSPVVIPRDEWVALQFSFHLSESAGYLRYWLNDTFIGETSVPTLVPSQVASGLQGIYLGDYWNGGSYTNNGWYIQNATITKATPGYLDSGGRAYIPTWVR